MRSIKQRLIVWLVVTLVLLFGLASLFCYVRAKTLLSRQFDESLLGKAHALCSLVQREADGRLEVIPPDALMPELGARPHPEYLQLWDATGKTVERSPSLGGHDLQ